MAGACAGGIKVEETNGDSIEPIPTLPLNDRPLLLEVLPVAPSIDDEQEDEQEPAETAPVAPEPSPGFIGSPPCRSSSDCLENLECADEDEGFDSGHCTQECELYCPDLEGYPTTFCPDLGDALTRCFQGANLNQAAHKVTAAKAIAAFQCRVQMHLRLFNMYAPPRLGSQTPASATTDVAWCKASNVSTTKRALVMPSFGNSIQRSSMQTRQLKMPSVI